MLDPTRYGNRSKNPTVAAAWTRTRDVRRRIARAVRESVSHGASHDAECRRRGRPDTGDVRPRARGVRLVSDRHEPEGVALHDLRNVNRNRMRDRSRAIVVVDGATVDQFDGADPSSETPETWLIRKASSDDLRAAIASLPRALGTAVWLRDIEGLSYAEMAKRLDIPVGTVMSRLSSGRARLYRRLSGNSTFGGRLRR